MQQIVYTVEAGIDVIQIRERDLEAAQLAALIGEALRVTAATRTRLVVNDRTDVALGCGADGVHLRADSLPAPVVRSLAPQGFLVGRSVHAAEETSGAVEGVDYLIAGTVFPTVSKPGVDRLLGVGGLAAVVRSVAVPVLAIGGVTPDRIEEVARTGAAGVAAIGLFMGGGRESAACRATPLVELARLLRTRFDTAKSGFLT